MALQPRPTSSISGDVNQKTGPGTRRSPSDTVGPTIKRTRINESAQSDRDKAANSGKYEAHSAGLGENPHQIPREGLFPDGFKHIGTV